MSPAAPPFLSAALSHPGLVRESNEDRVHCDEARGFFLVVDGMGGHAAGEQAASVALERIRGRLERQTDSVDQRVREAITLANNAIFEAAQTHPDWHGMACVLTVAVIQNGQATVGHVGDSRLYKIRNGQIEKITHDHSPVGEREDRGEMSEIQAMHHPRRNEVYRDVGSEKRTPDDEDFIEVRAIPFEQNSALLLCTDGLSDVLSSADILRIVEQNAGDPRASVEALIEAANRHSRDNVSAVLVEGKQFAASTAKKETQGRRPTRELLFLFLGTLLGLVPLMIHQWRHAAPQLGPQVIQVGPLGITTISEALQQAREGDTIEIAPGQYSEQVRLKGGVTIIALKPRESVIRTPQNTVPDGIGIIADSIRGARVIGLKIAGDEGAPLTIGLSVRNSDVNIERVEITGAKTTGVNYSGISQGVLQASYIHHNAGPGVVIEEPARPALENNVIIENGHGERPLPGIEIRSLAHPPLIGNTIAGNGAEPIWQTGPTDPVLFEKNFFSIGPQVLTPRAVRQIPPAEVTP